MPLRSEARRHRRRPDRRLVRAGAEAARGAVEHVVGVGRTPRQSASARSSAASSTRPRTTPRAAVRDADLVLVAAPVRPDRPRCCAAIAPRSRRERRGHRRRQHQAGRGRARRARRWARRIAQLRARRIRSPAPSRAAPTRRSPTCSAASSVVLTPLPENRAGRGRARAQRAGQACGARVIRIDAARARRGVRRGQPPAARARLRAGARARRARRRRPSCSTSPPAASATSRASPAARPEMWRDICVANRDALLGELDGYDDELAAARGAARERRRRGAGAHVRARRATRARGAGSPDASRAR